MPDADQAQGQEGTESVEAGVAADPEAATADTDNQETQDTKQSDDGESGKDENLYTLPDGREVDAETLSKEWKENFYPEFTKRSQELKKLRKERKQRDQQAQKVAEDSIEENKVLKNVDPKVKDAIHQLTKPLIQKELERRDQQRMQEQREQQFEKELSRLEDKYSGGDGLPKFDRNEVLEAMKADGNRIFDPEAKFKKMNSKEFNDYLINKALKKKQGGLKTERTGTGSQSRKPERKSPESIEDASRSLLERLKR